MNVFSAWWLADVLAVRPPSSELTVSKNVPTKIIRFDITEAFGIYFVCLG